MKAIVGLVSTKGGVGKTTAALNLAAELVRRGSTVTLIDADPAGAAGAVAADGRLPFPVQALLLEDAETKSVGAWVRAVKAAAGDFVIIDAPGAMGAAFGATLAVADLVIIPAGATVLDVRGAAETVGITRRHRKVAKNGKPDMLVLPSRIDRRTGAGRDAVATLAALTEAVGPAISYRAIVADSLASGEPVARDTDSGAEFAALADAVLTRLGADQ